MTQRWGPPLAARLSAPRPSLWDLAALAIVLGLVALLAWGGMAMGARYSPGQRLAISVAAGIRAQERIADGLGPALLARLLPRLRGAGRQEPAGREDPDPAPRCIAVGADPRLPIGHRDRLHRPVPGAALGRRVRRDFCDLHVAGLEHGVQRLSVAAHSADGAGRGGADAAAVALAALLAPRSAACRAPARLEHDDVAVRRLVLRRRLRGDHGFGTDDPAARHRLLHRDRDRAPRPCRDRLCRARDAGRHPLL